MSLAPTRPTLAEEAYARLEQMLVSLSLRPGEVLSESALAEHLSIGRTPLREAVQRLAREGLLTVMPRRGLMVARLDLSEMLQIIEVRQALDRIVLRGAAERMTTGPRRELARLRDGLALSDIGFMEADADIDRTIWDTAPNQHAVAAVRPLHTHCRRFWFKYRNDEDLQRSAELHREVVDALLAGDATTAVARNDKLLDYLTLFTKHILIAG